MYSVLIVDDDTVFRTRLKSLINWEKEGYVVIAEARNGKEAIEKMESLEPDIVITDISMPIINGIELIDYVAKFRKNTSIIAVSGYNDFNYVRDSLINGAEDYLLKNQLSAGRLIEVLRAAVRKLDSKNREEPVFSEESLIQEFLLLMISGCIRSREEIESRLRKLHLEPLLQGLAVAVAEPDNGGLINNLDEDEYYKFIYSLSSIMKETVSPESEIVITIIGRNRILILFPLTSYNIGLFKDDCRKILARIKDNIMRLLGESVSFGVSDLCKDIIKLPYYYEQAVKNLEGNRFQGKTGFIAETEIAQAENRILTLDITDEKDLLDALKGKGEYTPAEVIKRIFDRFDNCSSEDIQLVLAELLNILIREIQANNLSPEETFQENEINYQKVIKSMNIPELKDWFSDKYCKLQRCLSNLRTFRHYNENTQKAICYIEKNYSRDISLNDIADALNVNSSYLSRIFKNDTGQNIVEYLNKIRIEKAASLINEGKLPLKEIAFNVGIQNYYYFFKLYKKFTGITPGEYKKKDTQRYQNYNG